MYDILNQLIGGASTDIDKLLCVIIFYMILEAFADIVCSLINMGGHR